MKMLLQTFIPVVVLGVGVLIIAVYGLDSCQDPADIGFLVDASGSVSSGAFNKAKTFLINFIKQFDIANQAVKVSAFSFNETISKQGGFQFNSYSTEQEIATAIRSIVYTSGGTSFDIPLTFARKHMFVPQSGARGYTKKILIFITDGNAITTDEPGQLLRDMDVAVYAIGVGSNVNTDNLDKIATSANHRYIVLSFSLINDIKQRLTSQACEEIGEHVKDHPCKTNTNLCNFGICRITGTTSHRCDCDFGYIGDHCEIDINECEGVTCLNQGTCVDHVGYFICNCRQFYEGTYCETNICEPVAADVVFVIDVSASMDSTFLNHAKDHAELTTKEWQIDDDHFQIALATVGESANTVLGFSNIATKEDLRNGITNLNLKNEPSNVHLGLSKAVELLNTKGRLNVKKKIILYSDGLPSNPPALEQTLSYLKHYSNIEIYTVAIGVDVSHYFLSRISRVVSNVFPYNSDALWHHIMQDLIRTECNACIDSEQADVIIMVDLAGIQQDDLNSVVPTSLVKILSQIRLGNNAAKLALVTFSEEASTRFSFNAYLENNRVELQRSMSSYEGITEKSSNISEALKLAEGLLGDPTEGARSTAKKVVLVISEFKNALNEQDLRFAEVLRNNGIHMHTIGIFTDDIAFDTMSGLASTSYHIGINGNIYVDQIDTYIESFVQELKSLHCILPI
ncbi:cartilage matrix protein-like [Mytilus edulis]